VRRPRLAEALGLVLMKTEVLHAKLLHPTVRRRRSSDSLDFACTPR
jgi:hypothetical protein